MAPKRKELYRLGEADLEIFEKSLEDRNYFLDYYLRSPTSGTYFRPEYRLSNYPEAEDYPWLYNALVVWQNAYDALLAWWHYYDEPDQFDYDGDTIYVKRGRKGLIFHRHHGIRLLQWQQDVCAAEQPQILVLGGFGSGKTSGVLAGDALYYGATVPGYRCIFLGQHYTQYEEALKKVKALTDGTLYQKLFILAENRKPYPEIRMGNDLVGENNLIQCFSAGGSNGTAGMLSTEVDQVIVDQAEAVEDYPTMIREMGTRMRGQYQGREMMQRLVMLANQQFNDGMYDLAEKAITAPQMVRVFRPSTWENRTLTPTQLKNFIGYVGGSDEDIRVHMEGGDVIGGGEIFPASTIRQCHDPSLDDQMKLLNKSNPTGNYISERKECGIFEWVTEPLPGHLYCQIADAGTDNPPHRNSACIGVWDITNCPTDAAKLVAFFWVFGNNLPDPWVLKYVECATKYSTQLNNAFDATGTGAGYERWFPILQQLIAEPMSFNGGNKLRYIHAAQILMGRSQGSLMRMPNLPPMFRQMANYHLPDDTLRQDIVSMLILTAGWLERTFYHNLALPSPTELEENPYDVFDRYAPETEDRYGGALESHW